MGEYQSRQHFLSAYLESVECYKAIRDRIDQLLEQDHQIDDALHCEEFKRREAMTAFTQIRWLSVGDVVKVPHLLPHGLLHGVEVVEFQTPVYERKILSFTQKVQTQSHWDTQEALQLAIDQAEPEQQIDSMVIKRDSVMSLENIVEFDQFIVQRLCAKQRCQYNFEQNYSYALVMLVAGQCTFCKQEYLAKQAFFIARHLFEESILCSEDCILLIAYPQQHVLN